MTRLDRTRHRLGHPGSPPGRRSAARGADDGFTLIELLIVIVILPLVLGGLAVMLLAIFRAQGPVTNQLTGSADTQVASAILVQDVQSASYITTEPTVACGTTGTQILGTKSTNGQNVVSYVLIVESAGRDELVRQFCTGGVTSVASTSTVIATDVTTTQTATVRCSPAVTCNPSSAWIAGAGVSGVSISVNETLTGASFALSATPRLWNAASAGLASDPYPIVPLELLGTGSCPQTTLSLSGSATINVSGGGGAVMDNSTCSPSISLSGSAQITASAINTADPTPSSAITTTGSASAPSPVYAAANGDPFKSLVAPQTPTATGTGTCPASGSSGTCTPGNFSSAVSVTGSSTVLFGAGNYVFTQPVSIAGSSTVVFGSGNYLFEAGLSISGSSSVTFDAGTYVYEGSSASANAFSVSGSANLTSGPGGTMFYVASGVAGTSGSGSISLSGESQFDGIAIWQANTDTNALTLSGSSSVGSTYGGVYVPGATVTPSGSSGVVAAFVVADAVSFSGSSSLSVGG